MKLLINYIYQHINVFQSVSVFSLVYYVTCLYLCFFLLVKYIFKCYLGAYYLVDTGKELIWECKKTETIGEITHEHLLKILKVEV